MSMCDPEPIFPMHSKVFSREASFAERRRARILLRISNPPLPKIASTGGTPMRGPLHSHLHGIAERPSRVTPCPSP
ncbi:hypothetical protein A8E97_25810 [Burkholderia cenocepacia]|nr:hypothetical protein A8E88_15220 [Burkholderia cenocepacia]ONV83043.1 hypothetical protein A8E89_28620 [Burkholderia cenocepacia]ONV87587.1 hypothetical protein A8E89_22000 [Burkholderia cenocepacia]ONW13736.1 hypothetical protein A8E90_21395 [Burkholderia cenocepacia]ONW46358.1 hypothetical protein A8E93_08995 [Burkholderia cenocepacia]